MSNPSQQLKLAVVEARRRGYIGDDADLDQVSVGQLLADFDQSDADAAKGLQIGLGGFPSGSTFIQERS